MKRGFLALKKTLLLLACIHFAILIFLTIATNSLSFINLFSVLDINVLYPGIEVGKNSFVISSIVFTAIFLVFYLKKR